MKNWKSKLKIRKAKKRWCHVIGYCFFLKNNLFLGEMIIFIMLKNYVFSKADVTVGEKMMLLLHKKMMCFQNLMILLREIYHVLITGKICGYKI